MVLTSVAIPFAAVGWWLVGIARLPTKLADAERAPTRARLPHDSRAEAAA